MRRPSVPRSSRRGSFPDGLTFLKLAYTAEWAESEKRLEQIDDGKLANELDAVAGPEFLAELRLAHKAYGEALGVTKASPAAPQAPALLEPLRTVQAALAGYALQLAAWAEADPAAVATVRKALRPLDDYRAAQARRGGADVPAPPEPPRPATPATPIPQLPH